MVLSHGIDALVVQDQPTEPDGFIRRRDRHGLHRVRIESVKATIGEVGEHHDPVADGIRPTAVLVDA